MPSFESFLEAVYPVGVKKNQSCFTHTISHNSVNLHWISTNVGSKIYFDESFMGAKFQHNQTYIYVL